MQELRYLRDKIKTPGPAPFVTHATYPVEAGRADLWVYEPVSYTHLDVYKRQSLAPPDQEKQLLPV